MSHGQTQEIRPSVLQMHVPTLAQSLNHPIHDFMLFLSYSLEVMRVNEVIVNLAIRNGGPDSLQSFPDITLSQ